MVARVPTSDWILDDMVMKNPTTGDVLHWTCRGWPRTTLSLPRRALADVFREDDAGLAIGFRGVEGTRKAAESSENVKAHLAAKAIFQNAMISAVQQAAQSKNPAVRSRRRQRPSCG